MQFAIIENGVVVNVAAASRPLRENWVASETAAIGDTYNADTGEFSRPSLPPPTCDECRADAQRRVDAGYTSATNELTADYTDRERESWPIQVQEAAAIETDPAASTPWIDAAAAERGIDRLELAGRIRAMDTAYRIAHGTLTGCRQRLYDEIRAVDDDDPDAIEKLNAIYWPVS